MLGVVKGMLLVLASLSVCLFGCSVSLLLSGLEPTPETAADCVSGCEGGVGKSWWCV